MGFWSFLLLVILILVGAVFYHRLQRMEREIRAELRQKEEDGEAALEMETSVEVQKSVVPAPSVVQATKEPAGIEEQILSVVQNEPGVVQIELYKRFPEQPRKSLQELLRKLDQEGKICREKAKGSYQLYPV